MRIKYLLCAFAFLSIFLSAEVTSAQLTVINVTNTALTVTPFWANDDCSNPGTTTPSALAANSTVNLPLSPTGAYKGMLVLDLCSGAAVENPQGCLGFGGSVASFIDCGGNNLTAVWINENTAAIF